MRVPSVLLVALLGLGGVSAAAQSGIDPYDIERVGQSGWQFLKINGDARQAAMGGAFVAGARGSANDIFGNPAALAYVDDVSLALNRTEWVADVGYHAVGLARRFGRVGVFGVSVAALDYGDLAEAINEPIEGENRTRSVLTGDTFGAGDLAAGLSYARRITDRLAIGGNVRWIREHIADVSMTGWSLDFGTHFYTGFRSLRLAFTARNFGPDARFLGYSEEYQSEPTDVRMPVEFRFGTAMDFLERAGREAPLTVSVAAYQANDGPAKVDVGAEGQLAGLLSLRAGYRFNYDSQDVTLGAGLGYDVGGYGGALHYAYLGFGDLGQVHMFSVLLRRR